MDREKRIIASKKLTRYKIAAENSLFRCNVIWCRTTYESGPTAMNKHTFYELHYILDGTLMIGSDTSDGSVQTPIPSDHFVLIPPYFSHSTLPTGDTFEKLVCGFSIESDSEFVTKALSLLHPDKTSVPKAYKATPAMETLVSLMLENALYGKGGASAAISALFECLILELLRQINPESRESENNFKIFENDIRVKEIQSFIEQNIALDITGEDVARQLNISMRHLNRITNEHLHCSVSRLIAARKFMYIKELLMMPELTLRDIAERTGFQSEYSLNRFFKKHEGMSIGTYRRSMSNF